MKRAKVRPGNESVRYMLDRCRELGLRKIYWRCLDGGRALYASELLEGESVGWDEDCYQAWAWGEPATRQAEAHRRWYRKGFDSLKEAVRYGHRQGMEIHAWMSINEDDHAWGGVSRFSRTHPPSFRHIIS